MQMFYICGTLRVCKGFLHVSSYLNVPKAKEVRLIFYITHMRKLRLRNVPCHTASLMARPLVH